MPLLLVGGIAASYSRTLVGCPCARPAAKERRQRLARHGHAGQLREGGMRRIFLCPTTLARYCSTFFCPSLSFPVRHYSTMWHQSAVPRLQVKLKRRGSDAKYVARVLAVGTECDIGEHTPSDSYREQPRGSSQ